MVHSVRPVSKLLATGLLIGVSACGTVLADGGDEAAIKKMIVSFDSAWNRKDTTAVAGLMAPGYVYFSSQGRVTLRAELLTSLAAPHYRLEYADRSELQVHQFGASAVVSSRWRGRGIWEGREFVDDQRCSLVLGWNSTGWRLMSEHCTQITS